MPLLMHTLHVDLGDRGYPVYIGRDLLADMSLLAQHVTGSQVVIVSNETVAPLYLERVKAALGPRKLVTEIILPDGEQYKTLETLSTIFDRVMVDKHDRTTTFVAVGGGVVGDNAAAMAVGMGADVTILDRSISRLRELDAKYEGRARCVYSTNAAIEQYALEADLVIGAVLIPGAEAPTLLSHDLVGRMQKGAVVVDVAIDQGGCFETSRATTHDNPTFAVNDIVHYCVANMPGGVARTATMALNNATLPYALALADDPINALFRDQNLQQGLNVHRGKVTYKAVADTLGYPYVPADEALKA